MTLVRRVGILSTGSYVPERVLTNQDLEKLVDTSDEWIVTRTGMRERRIAAPDQATSDLCAEAGRRALAAAGLDPLQVDLVIVASVTPDHCVPATSAIVQDRLGCRNAGAFDMEAACSGFVQSLAVARGLIASGSMETVLVLGGECMSRILNYQDRASCILFGDGAGAAVVSAQAARGEILDTFMGADGSGAMTMVVPASGSRHAPDADAVERGLHKLHIRGNEVFKFAVSKFRELLERQLATARITPDQISLVVPHQVNFRIIESALKKLDLDMDRVFMNLEKYGNTSGASVGIALDEAHREGRLPEGGYVSLLAFGAGLTWASALLRW